MTKKELIKKLDELNGVAEDLSIAVNEANKISKEIHERLAELPTEEDEIDDSEVEVEVDPEGSEK